MAGHPLLIFGAGGQIGQALLRAAPRHGYHAVGLTRANADVTDPASLAKIAADYPAAPVINASGYTAVDAAENDVDAAMMLNGIAPAFLASLFCDDRPLIHYSTDYVFDGTANTPWTEQQECAPLGVYGSTKRAGELAVLRARQGYVLRTAWVYGPDGKNFLKTMLRIGQEKGAAMVVEDQIGTPTHADDIAEATLTLLRAEATAGIYHLTASGETSWYGFAREIFAALEAETGQAVDLRPCASDAFQTAATRPTYSVLSGEKIDAVPGIARPDWRAPIPATVHAVLNSHKKHEVPR